KDVNNDGRFYSGDTLTLTFTEPIIVYTTGAGLDPAADFVLPVAGDDLGSAKLAQGPTGFDLVITLARNTILNPNGSFSAALVAPGSPSAIDIRAGIPTTVLSDQLGRALQGGAPIDVDGTLTPPPPPVVTAATYVDADLSGTVSLGDELHLCWSEAI